MIDTICTFLTNRIRKEMPEIDDERAEVINYGLQNIVGEIPKIFLLFIISFILGMLKEVLFMFIVLTPYRGASGGFHLKTHLGCIVGTTAFYCGIVLLSQHVILDDITKYILIGISWIFGMFMIKLYAPADTENVPILSKKDRKPINILKWALFLALLDEPNVKGYVFEQYIQITIQFNAQQIYRQMTIDLQQQKQPDITNDIYQNLIKRQNNSKLNINGNKISGDIDTQMIGLNNIAKVEGIKEIDNNAQVRFIAVEDEKTTPMCHSLDGQLFYINKENIFNRHYSETQKDLRIEKIKCFGLVIGLNLPPISHHFHWCRSTIIYQT